MEEKQLRRGYTTGTCAAAAAKAAAVLLFTGEMVSKISVHTPKGTNPEFEILYPEKNRFRGLCCVRKDAGDDPDVTHGSLIRVSASDLMDEGKTKDDYYMEQAYPGVFLTGGTGVGTVTRPGLSCPVGMTAINPVPRQMIIREAAFICREFDYRGELYLTVSVPEGLILAEKTFNPRLGIQGGISILGTSGIVEPMSEAALLETIRLEIHMRAAAGQSALIMAPGNYGEEFLRSHFALSLDQGVKCSNFIEASLSMAAKEGMNRLLFAGHIGKLIKVYGGMPNTHSGRGDNRMQFLCGATRASGGTEELCSRILASNTTEEAIVFLEQWELLPIVMKRVVDGIRRQMMEWSEHRMSIEVVTFSSVYGILGMTAGAGALASDLKELQR